MKKLLILGTLLFVGCAQRGNPSGGEGDVTPPLFVKTVPATETINVPVDGKIELKFNEWVEPASAEKAISLHPMITDGYKVKTSGKTVTIKANESFGENTTYHVSINSELKDFYNNRLVDPVSMVFSTGDKIDSGAIVGTAILENDNNAVPLKISLFRKARLDSTTDTTLFSEPDYFTQCDTLGRFAFENINEGTYRIIGFRDKNSDNLLTPGEIGFITDELYASTDSVQEYILNRVTTDTTALKITKPSFVTPRTMFATVNNKGHLPDSLYIVSVDTVESDTFYSTEFSLFDDSVTLAVQFKDSIPSDQYELFSFIDNPIRAGVHNGDTIDTLPYLPVLVDTVRFNAITTESDTTRPQLKGWTVKKRKTVMPELELTWDLPVKATGTFALSDTNGNSYPLSVPTSFGKKVVLAPKERLPRETELSLSFNLNQFETLTEMAPDSLDTVLTLVTMPEQNIALSLLLNYPECNDYNSWIWSIQSVTTADLKLPLTKTPEGYLAEDLPADDYTVVLLNDRNGDGIYNGGTLFPTMPGERRIFLPDTVKAKGRWRTELQLDTPCDLLRQEVVVDTVQDSVTVEE